MSNKSELTNPLIRQHTLPPFSEIRPEHIHPAIHELIERNLRVLDQQLTSMETFDWESIAAPISEREDELSRAWSTVSHLNAVDNSEALRKEYQVSLAELTQYSTQMSQNKTLFDAYKKLSEQDEFSLLKQSQKKTIENSLRDFRLAGVDLEDEKKERYAKIQARLSELSNQFSNNVLDATQGWYKHLKDQSMLEGMPENAVEGAKQAAQTRELEGYVLTLDAPVYMTVMSQAKSSALREEMYNAYMTRASDQGPTAGKWDNSDIIEEIMQLRQELAQVLGFENYSEVSLAPKMAASTQQVINFLEDLAKKSNAQAQRELAELNAWTKDNFAVEELAVWDVPYYSERMKEARYALNQEELRPYFPLSKVLEGLFNVASRLFDVEFKELQNFESWHKDVRLFRISRNNETIAQFYLDAFARPGKRGGAWKATCRDRCLSSAGLQLPVAYLVCNFSPPVGDKPGLLTHSDVTTLFHEFGHGLHHMLTKIDVSAVSGINGVAWDAVELPSQFLENWCWLPEVIQSISAHYETGEPLPEEKLQALLKAKNFQSALFMLRQLEFALFDFRLHIEYGSENFTSVQNLLDEVREQVAVISPPEFNRFQHGFSHIFAGGYAAGYYSYKWAEVLSADAFSLFEEKGAFDKTSGEKFLQEILEKGGSEDAMALFVNFRGREPSVDALLRHSGIEANA